MGNGLASFAVGFGGGYMGAQRQGELDKERQADRAMRQQEFDARMGEVNDKKNLRMSLADAARPVTVESGAGGMIRPETMDNRDVGLPENTSQPNNGLSLSQYRVKGKSFDTQAQADAAAATQNAPDAVAQRQGLAYRQAGRPDQALDIEQKQAQITAQNSAQARKLKEEGVFNAVRALRAGDASGVATAFNEGGEYKIDGLPVITQEERDIPGVGKVPTYTAKLRMIGPDGKAVDKVYNSHDLSMQMMPYEKALELQRKGSDSDNKFTYQAGMLDAKGKQIELQGELGAARAAAAGAKANGQPSREERMRYTTLFQDAGRRAGEAQKALTTLQKDPMYSMAKPGSPQHEELQGLRDAIKSYGDERTMYQGMLAGSQGGEAAPAPTAAAPAAPGLASVRPGTASRTPAPATQAARDKDQRFILEGEMEKARQQLGAARTPEERTRAQYDIDTLTREIGRLPGSKPAAAAPRTAAPGLANAKVRTVPNPLSGPQQISSAAERDALPKGTKYIAPNGKTYEKQ